MKNNFVLIDFIGSTAHFTAQLELALNNKVSVKTNLITAPSGIVKNGSVILRLWQKFMRIISLLVNYVILFIKIIVCSPSQVFIFNIPLISSFEIFFLWLIKLKRGISVGILHNHIASHGEKKSIRNYKYYEFYNHCDIVVFHDSSIVEIFDNIFPDSFPMHLKLPSYTIPENYRKLAKKKSTSSILTLGIFGTIRPYKNLEIVVSELEKLTDRQTSLLSLKLFGKAFYNIDSLIDKLEKLGLADFEFDLESLSDEQFFGQMASCDFLLLPHSSSSGSGLLSVAASLGIPVIASNLIVFSDFVNEYQSGIIFDHDLVGDLSNVLIDLIGNEQQQKNLRNNALRAVVSQPSWSGYVDQISKCCESLRARRPL